MRKNGYILICTSFKWEGNPQIYSRY